MDTTYHIYTSDELNCSGQTLLPHNWKPQNYLTYVEINDPNAGVRNAYFAAFNTKLDALIYFRNFISDIYSAYQDKNYFFKLNQINNIINLIKTKGNDKDIDLSIVDFDFEDLSLNTLNSGYWVDASKLILKQIIEDLNFDIQSDNEDPDLDNPEFSFPSLKKVQEECKRLVYQDNICNPIFIEKFNKMCKNMNDFLDYWFD